MVTLLAQPTLKNGKAISFSEFLYARFDFEAEQRQISAHESIFLARHFYNNQVQSPHPGCFENEL
jgi:hypothetical protein